MPKPTTKNTRSIEELLIIAISVVATVTITPFLVYRYINDQYLVASLELIVVLMMIALGIYVWKTKEVKIPSIATSISMMVGLVVLNYLIGSSIIFWVYPIIITIYFLNSLKVSAMIVTPAIFALIPLLIKEKSVTEICSILVTLGICQLCGYILSKKIRDQHSRLQEMINQDGLTRALNRY